MDSQQVHASEAICNTLASIINSLDDDDQFSPVDLSIFKSFAVVCSTVNSNIGKEKDHETFFTVAKASGVDLSNYHKEGAFIQALWVIYLASLKYILVETEYKYQTLDNFLTSYAGAFDDVDIKEKTKLFHTANWMAIMFKLIPARKNKGLAINVIPKLVEGWRTKYVTGSGQKPATALRVLIFQTEGHVKPSPRGHRHQDDDHSHGESDSGVEVGVGAVKSLDVLPLSSIFKKRQSRGSSNSSESTDDLERVTYSKKSKSILAKSEAIEAQDHKHDLEWEKNADIFKKTEFSIIKHGNHGFIPINHNKEKNDTHNIKSAKRKAKVYSSYTGMAHLYSSLPVEQPELKNSISQQLLRDSVNTFSSGILSRDVSAMIKDDEMSFSNSLSVSFFGTNLEDSFFDGDSSDRSATGQDIVWFDSIDTIANTLRTNDFSLSNQSPNCGILGKAEGSNGLLRQIATNDGQNISAIESLMQW